EAVGLLPPRLRPGDRRSHLLRRASLHSSRRGHHTLRGPRMTWMAIEMSASTRRMWMKPPRVYELTRPTSQPATRSTAMVQSMMDSYGWGWNAWACSAAHATVRELGRLAAIGGPAVAMAVVPRAADVINLPARVELVRIPGVVGRDGVLQHDVFLSGG